METNNMTEVEILTSPQMSGSFDAFSRAMKSYPFVHDDDSLNFCNAKLGQSHLPWYLRPSYNSDTLKVDSAGHIKAGTLPALVERLTVDLPGEQLRHSDCDGLDVKRYTHRRIGSGDRVPQHLPDDFPGFYFARKTFRAVG